MSVRIYFGNATVAAEDSHRWFVAELLHNIRFRTGVEGRGGSVSAHATVNGAGLSVSFVN
jgi:hypothetical protein